MPPLSQRLTCFPPSQIAVVFDLAQKLQAEGRKIYDLSSGEPDFDTIPQASAAGHQAIDEGETKYTSTDGTAALKAAIRGKLVRDGHPSYDDSCLAIGGGAKPLLATILMTLLDAGDQVIIPAPCWTSHPGMVQALHAEAVVVPCDDAPGMKLSPESLASAITPKTKALILCSPNNPTGVTYTADELRALEPVLLDHPDIWTVSDEIYSDIVFDGRVHASFAVALPSLAGRTITVNGLSKGYAMTGWRVGYAAGPEPVMAGLRQLMSQISGSPSSISQIAGIAALDAPTDHLRERCAIYQERRDTVVRILSQTDELRPLVAEGAFYTFVDCRKAIGKHTPDGTEIRSSMDLVTFFLESEGVAVVPGEAFHSTASFRLSFASSMDVLLAACEGMKSACSKLT